MPRGKKVTDRKELKAIFAKRRVGMVTKTASLKKNKPPVPSKYPAVRPIKLKIKQGRFSEGNPDYFRLPQDIRVDKEIRVAKQDGEASVVGALRSVAVKKSKKNKRVAKEANSDIDRVSGSMIGKKYVGYPRGFSQSTNYKRARRKHDI